MKESKKSDEGEGEEEAESSVKTAGCILYFKGCGDTTSREDIKVVGTRMSERKGVVLL